MGRKKIKLVDKLLFFLTRVENIYSDSIPKTSAIEYIYKVKWGKLTKPQKAWYRQKISGVLS